MSSPIVRPVTVDGLAGFTDDDRFVVGEPDRLGRMTYTSYKDVRTSKCTICGHGWEPTSESLRDQTYWELLRETVHESCLYRHLGLVEREKVHQALCRARIPFGGLVAIPNGYWPKSYHWASHMPWYRADVLKRGFNPTDRVPRGVHICIGHRKRVWEISVTCDTTTDNAIPWYADAEKAFAAEEVTKFFGPKKIIVHAWNDKLHEYLNTIAVVGDLRLDPAR